MNAMQNAVLSEMCYSDKLDLHIFLWNKYSHVYQIAHMAIFTQTLRIITLT